MNLIEFAIVANATSILKEISLWKTLYSLMDFSTMKSVLKNLQDSTENVVAAQKILLLKMQTRKVFLHLKISIGMKIALKRNIQTNQYLWKIFQSTKKMRM